jgi:hypothetical protein
MFVANVIFRCKFSQKRYIRQILKTFFYFEIAICYECLQACNVSTCFLLNLIIILQQNLNQITNSKL